MISTGSSLGVDEDEVRREVCESSVPVAPGLRKVLGE